MPLLQDALKEFQPLYDEIQDCEWQLIYEFSTNADDKPEIADKVKSFLSSKLSALLEEVYNIADLERRRYGFNQSVDNIIKAINKLKE